jgi:hypothetical protein
LLPGLKIIQTYRGILMNILLDHLYKEETGNKVYVTSDESAIIVESENVKLLGNAREYIGE